MWYSMGLEAAEVQWAKSLTRQRPQWMGWVKAWKRQAKPREHAVPVWEQLVAAVIRGAKERKNKIK